MSPARGVAAPSPPAPAEVPLPGALARKLKGMLGEDGFLTDPGRLLVYESDGLTQYRRTPRAVALPRDTDEAARVLSLLAGEGVPVVPRGAGTGLSGGALATPGAVVVGTARMSGILELDAPGRRARLLAGTVNARLSEAARPYGLYFAPDPSSQTACTLGGNAAENSGGPHCLKYGVTSRYVRALTVVLPEGDVVRLGDDPRGGLDLVGLFVGSEGCFGFATEIEVSLLPLPGGVRTLLAIFDRIEDAGRAVTDIIAAGLLPAALEIIDGETIRAVEASVFAAGYPTDAGAALVVEFDGTEAALDAEAEAAGEACRAAGAREVRRARDEDERAALWKGRKKAFGAMGRVAPDLMVQDATVPRSRLPDVLARIGEIGRTHGLTVANVFHAGDGNLHPNILFDRRDEELVERVERASTEIMRACVEAGGTITGEHGVGVDKRRYMELVHGEAELGAMAALRHVFDPRGRFNPGKVLPDDAEAPAHVIDAVDAVGPPTADGAGRPAPVREAAIHARDDGEPPPLPAGVVADDVDLERWSVHGVAPRGVVFVEDEPSLARLLADASETGLGVAPAGAGGSLSAGGAPRRDFVVASVRRMDRILQYEPADLTMTVQAGASLETVRAAAAEQGQWLPLVPSATAEATVGATLALAEDGPLSEAYGRTRDLVLGLTAVTGDGRVVRAGGRVVKNVAGFDLVRLMVGSRGCLGILTEATLRLWPRPAGDVLLVRRAPSLETLLGAARVVATAPVVPAAVELVEGPAGFLDAAAAGRDPFPVGRAGAGREAALVVRVAGTESAVAADAETLALAMGAGEGEVERLEGEAAERMRGATYGPTGADLILSLRLPRGRLRELIELARGVGRLDRARDVLSDSPVRARLRPATGEMRLAIPRVRSDPDRAGDWGRRLAEVRSTLEWRGGGLAVLAGPGPVVRAMGPGGGDPLVRRLEARLRAAFDPAGILPAGRSVH